MFLWVLPLALAEPPHFDAELADDARIATASWGAAAACMGWEPPVHEVVRIERGQKEEVPVSHAVADERGLHDIRLRVEASPMTVAHEVSHAWFHEGPAALVEGRTQVLAECVADRLPQVIPVRTGFGYPLDDMPDLREWTHQDRSTLPGRKVEAAGYAGSMRLALVLAGVLPQEWLLSESLSDWSSLEAALEQAGPEGARVLALLRGGAETQRAALSDPDEDALLTFHEHSLGTDPEVWDSDGDGWWDGAQDVPEGAQPLPRDGSAVCLVQVPADAKTVTLTHGGILRGFDLNTVSWPGTSAGATVAMTGAMRVFSGGVWIKVEGDELAPNRRCGLGRGYMVRAMGEEEAELLKPLALAVGAALERAEVERISPRTQLQVELGGRHSRMVLLNRQGTSPRVQIPLLQLRWAQDKERMDALAAQALALHLLAETGERELRAMGAAGALAQVLVDDPIGKPLVDAHPSEIRSWTRRVEELPGGWGALLE